MDTKKLTAGAISGALAALAVDYRAYAAWKTAHDGTAYDWTVAFTRVLQGALTGAVAAAGVGAAS